MLENIPFDERNSTARLEAEIQKFMKNVRQMKENGGLRNDHDFLRNLANDVQVLNRQSVEILSRSNNSDLRDICTTIHSIVTQSLKTCDGKRVTMVDAAKELAEKNEEETIASVVEEFNTHPEATETLIVELHHLTEDVKDCIRRAM